MRKREGKEGRDYEKREERREKEGRDEGSVDFGGQPCGAPYSSKH